jgi:hypothetical protein
MKLVIAALAVAIAPCAIAAEVIGQKPGYLEAIAPTVPNEAAIGKRIFVPDLEEGWIPQGLAAGGEYLYLSSYRPTPDVLKDEHGPCRIYRIESTTGKLAGRFDVPQEACNSHAGGVAYIGDGKLVLADTYDLSRIDLVAAFAAGNPQGAIQTVKTRKGDMHGSFAAAEKSDAWIGTWSKEADKSRLYKLPADFFARQAGQTVDSKIAAEVIPVPVEAQGAAFDGQGNVWVTTSRSNKMSKLYRIDRQGKVAAEYDMPMGLEGIAFDPSGKLWGVSESGTRKYQRWGTPFHFPFVFEIDTSKLK